MIYDNISDADLGSYIKGLKELDEIGVDFIIMVCNTIHLFYDKLQKMIQTPILDLRRELKKRLIRNKIKAVTILGTPSTIKGGLYKFNDIKYLDPTGKELNQLTKAIFNFNKGIRRSTEKFVRTLLFQIGFRLTGTTVHIRKNHDFVANIGFPNGRMLQMIAGVSDRNSSKEIQLSDLILGYYLYDKSGLEKKVRFIKI